MIKIVVAWLNVVLCTVTDLVLHSFGGLAAQLLFAPVLFVAVWEAMQFTLEKIGGDDE